MDEEVQVTSKDEIGRLAVAYNHMAKSIRETQKVLEKRAEEAVEGRQQVLEAMHVTADAQSAAEASHRRLEESYLKLERQMKEIQAKVVSSVATVERNSSSYSPI
jgi:nitrate/nitrite-specific signal transduction histidine kinase